jgi:tubulin monoglycylase TTLL3/8
MSGKNTFYEEIQPQMKKIVICAIESCLELVEPRKNSMELFGFDFMIDENLKPWIIEINSSPAMDYSSVRMTPITSKFFKNKYLKSLLKPVTERLVKMVLEDAIKVGVDYRMQKKSKKAIETGLFKLIYKGKNM